MKINEEILDGRAILAFVWKGKLYKKGIIFDNLPGDVVEKSFISLGRVMYRNWKYIKNDN